MPSASKPSFEQVDRLRGPFRFTKGTRPQPGRLIDVRGSDLWGEFTCVGKIEQRDGQSRPKFLRRDRNEQFVHDQDTWADVETWEYINE